MQVSNEKDIEKRLLYYWSKMFINSIKEGKRYTTLEKSIAILIADFKLENLKHIEKYISKWNIREEENHQTILTEMLELYIIEIPKYKEGKGNSELDNWIKFIENPEVINMQEKNKAIVKAKEVLEEISQDGKERYLAELREKYIFDHNTLIDTGIDKGIKQGIKQGKDIEKVSIAKKMKKEKINIETICRCTGLTKEEIEKL